MLNVCALHYNPSSGRLISGSWDHTARVWTRKAKTVGKDGGAALSTGSGAKEWVCEHTLNGHEEAVWGVAAVHGASNGVSYITGRC